MSYKPVTRYNLCKDCNYHFKTQGIPLENCEMCGSKNITETTKARYDHEVTQLKNTQKIILQYYYWKHPDGTYEKIEKPGDALAIAINWKNKDYPNQIGLI